MRTSSAGRRGFRGQRCCYSGMVELGWPSGVRLSSAAGCTDTKMSPGPVPIRRHDGVAWSAGPTGTAPKPSEDRPCSSRCMRRRGASLTQCAMRSIRPAAIARRKGLATCRGRGRPGATQRGSRHANLAHPASAQGIGSPQCCGPSQGIGWRQAVGPLGRRRMPRVAATHCSIAEHRAAGHRVATWHREADGHRVATPCPAAAAHRVAANSRHRTTSALCGSRLLKASSQFLSCRRAPPMCVGTARTRSPSALGGVRTIRSAPADAAKGRPALCALVGQIRPFIDHWWPELDQHRPNLFRNRPHAAPPELPRIALKLARHRPKLARTRPT